MQLETLPPFNSTEHYKELTPLEGKYKYRFVTLDDVEIRFKNPILPKGKKILFTDSNGKLWLEITHTSIIISKDYAWDGCTPKKWWGIWWGTPDFEETVLASLVHDALIQFELTDDFPFTRSEENFIFKSILHENEFVFENLYYMGVEFWKSVSSIKNVNIKSLTIKSSD